MLLMKENSYIFIHVTFKYSNTYLQCLLFHTQKKLINLTTFLQTPLILTLRGPICNSAGHTKPLTLNKHKNKGHKDVGKSNRSKNFLNFNIMASVSSINILIILYLFVLDTNLCF